jgi:hypothetical protein
MNRTAAISHFRQFGARCDIRHVQGRDLMGIQLRGSNVTDSDLAYLKYLADVVDVVGLENTTVTDAGLTYLLPLKVLDNVDLTNTGITDKGLNALSNITTLEFIHIEGTKVSAQGVRNLQSLLPKCSIASDFEE